MATISNVTIGLELDNSVSPAVLKITDNTAHTPDSEDVKGYVTITQPDGTTQTFGSFASPLVVWDVDALTVGEAAIRLDVNGEIQQGAWVVSYLVRNTGFDDTTLTTTFDFTYQRPTITLAPHVNYYQPVMKVKDTTTYNIGESVNKTWTAIAQGIGAVNAATGDDYYLAIDDKYYDTAYDVLFTANIYGLDGDIYYRDKIVKSVQVNPIVDMPALLDALNAMYDASKTKSDKSEYLYAWSVFQHLRVRTSNCETNITEMWEHLQNLLGVSITYSKAELEYDWMGEHCGCEDTGMNTLLAPTLVAGTPTASTIPLTWNLIPGATNYVVENALSEDGPWDEIYSGPLLTYTDTFTSTIDPVYYRVYAEGTGYTNSANSNIVSESLVSTTVYFGAADTDAVLSEATILAANEADFRSTGTVNGDFRTILTNKYLWLAERSTQPTKTVWYCNNGDNGAIDSGDEFEIAFTVAAAEGASWRVYMSTAATTKTANTTQFRVS